MNGFNVTYEIVTPESAEHGDADERGFISEGVSLREAVSDVMETRTSLCEGVTAVSASESPITSPHWLTVDNGAEFETGARESRSLHFPANATAASRRRVARLLGCYGA